MAEDEKGHSKGFAFLEFEQEVCIHKHFLLYILYEFCFYVKKDALGALAANNHELKKRRIAVTLADSRARAKTRYVACQI